MPRKNAQTAIRRPAGQRFLLRIIGGEWRGRKIRFPPVEAIRPTPDRVRETVFNWLQSEVPGSRCLDLFAGSGALGLEALSRGAREVVFVDHDRDAVWHLRETLVGLGCDRGQVIQSDAGDYLAAAATPFDLVFLDPPYTERLLAETCRRLEAGGWLKPGGFAYLENAADDGPPELPAGWVLLKSKRAGDVGYHLARRAVTRAG